MNSEKSTTVETAEAKPDCAPSGLLGQIDNWLTKAKEEQWQCVVNPISIIDDAKKLFDEICRQTGYQPNHAQRIFCQKDAVEDDLVWVKTMIESIRECAPYNWPGCNRFAKDQISLLSNAFWKTRESLRIWPNAPHEPCGTETVKQSGASTQK